ncbi:SDR family oxidoreductase [Cellulophaga baltica 4]|nr:SDR family oxidoreductase [Cellulophaga baltica 4]
MGLGQEKVVWITGASSGIGEALTYAYATSGAKVVISARNIEGLQAVKQKCPRPNDIYILPLDLLKLEEFNIKTNEAWNAFGTIDLLINNAGASQRSLIIETDMEVYKKLMDINYLGTVALSKAILPKFLLQNKGQFAVVSSLMGKFSSPYRSGYCGVKHALHGFFDALRMEHEKDGITVTIICPGFIQTDVAKNALVGDGSKNNTEDKATENGLAVNVFAARMKNAIEKKKFEAYIGKKEVLGIYLKRFFPKLLHKIVLKSEVR